MKLFGAAFCFRKLLNNVIVTGMSVEGLGSYE